MPACLTRRALGVACALLAAPICLAQPAPPSPENLGAQVDVIAKQAVDSAPGVGLSVAVLRDGQSLLERGYGLADLEFGAPADGETMFRIGSITKQFTAALVMRQVEAGALSLDDPLTKFFPDWPAPGERVTIRHLLQHTSGIKSYTGIGSFMEAFQVDRTNEEMLAVFRDEAWDFEPGDAWSYNNSGYYLLGVILEQLAGAPWAAQVNALAQELGLARTMVDDNDAVLANRAQGYAWSGDSFVNDRFISPTVPGAAGAMLSTAGDLVRWSEMLATEQVVSAESYALMTTPTTLNDGSTFPYGFGLMVEPVEERDAVGHGGGIFGFNSFLLRIPGDDGLTVAVISNSETLPSDASAMKILRAALGIEAPEAAPTDADLLASVQGVYRIDAVGLEVRVFLRDGELFTKAGDQPAFAMIHEGAGVFRLDLGQRIELAFDLSASPAPGFTLRQGGSALSALRVDAPGE
ncbi:MAG: serine hydrolase domain-containing protein [Phycisphaerales bacterium]